MNKASVLFLSLAVAGCASTPPTPREATTCPGPLLRHEKLNAVLWMQDSAEYEAVAGQVYQRATAALKEAVADPAAWPADTVQGATPAGAPLAVILDIDETVFDNSPADVRGMHADNRKFDPGLWKTWEEQGEPDLVPGAEAFLTQAAASKVTVFYVSNRSQDARLEKLLRDRKLPVAAADVIRLPDDCSTGGTSSDKECRRRDVAAKYRVLMLVGDDLGDFAPVKGKSNAERHALVAANQARWGRDWHILPNPSYGSWERIYFDQDKDEGDVILRKKTAALSCDAKGAP